MPGFDFANAGNLAGGTNGQRFTVQQIFSWPRTR